MTLWKSVRAGIAALMLLPAFCNGYTLGPTYKRASDLLTAVRHEAQQVAVHAAQLDDLRNIPADVPTQTWNVSMVDLRRMKVEIGDMGRRLSNLEQMEPRLSPQQTQVIQRLVLTAERMAEHTDYAVKFVARHGNGIWAAPFREDVASLRREAGRASQSLAGHGFPGNPPTSSLRTRHLAK